MSGPSAGSSHLPKLRKGSTSSGRPGGGGGGGGGYDLPQFQYSLELNNMSNDNSLFRMLQEVNPDLAVPHLSQIEGLSLEMPTSFFSGSLQGIYAALQQSAGHAPPTTFASFAPAASANAGGPATAGNVQTLAAALKGKTAAIAAKTAAVAAAAKSAAAAAVQHQQQQQQQTAAPISALLPPRQGPPLPPSSAMSAESNSTAATSSSSTVPAVPDMSSGAGMVGNPAATATATNAANTRGRQRRAAAAAVATARHVAAEEDDEDEDDEEYQNEEGEDEEDEEDEDTPEEDEYAEGKRKFNFLSGMDLASVAQPSQALAKSLLDTRVLAADAAIKANVFPARNTFGDERKPAVDSATAATVAAAVAAAAATVDATKRKAAKTKSSGSQNDGPSPKRRTTVPKRQPKRSDFASEEAFVAAWTQWREVREKNNAAVQRSREKAKLKKTQQRQALRAQEREFDALRQEVVVLRKNVSLLLKAVSQPTLLTDIERAWVQTLSTSEGGGTLASQCSL